MESYSLNPLTHPLEIIDILFHQRLRDVANATPAASSSVNPVTSSSSSCMDIDDNQTSASSSIPLSMPDIVSDFGESEYFDALLANAAFLDNVPYMTKQALGTIPQNSLVRFRGTVQGEN